MVRQYRDIWARDAVLRAFYAYLWDLGLQGVSTEPVVELGGGAGFIREFYPKVISTDILPFPESNLQCDATRLPFRKDSIGCFIGVAFFHHCTRPADLIGEVFNALKPGGYLVIVDPYISVLSRWIYRYATDEDVDLNECPLDPRPDNPVNPLLDANVARATLVFMRQRDRYQEMFPQFPIVRLECMNLFRHIPAGSCVQKFPMAPCFYPPTCALDVLLSPLRKWTGMVMRVVLQKQV